MIVCSFEDRPNCLVGLKLMVLSVRQWCPDLPIELFMSVTDKSFSEWVGAIPGVHVNTDQLNASGWDVKPSIVLNLLERGHDEVVWIDSDIIVTRDFAARLGGLAPDRLALTQEALYEGHDTDGDALRARAWGFTVGRTVPFALNSCVIRATQSHIPLLRRWRDTLQDPRYVAAQKISFWDRPIHLLSDQEVLTALLTSQEFADVPLHFLTRGRDIVHFLGLSGFTSSERLGQLATGRPLFLHALGVKPWGPQPKPEPGHQLREAILGRYRDLSPYVDEARKYRHALGEDAGWMASQYASSAALRALGFGNPALVGLPIAAAMDAGRLARSLFRRSPTAH
jgi:hypothetical protein